MEIDPNIEVIEQLIDRKGISWLLEAVAEIAYSKANHVRENWQDESLGKAWDSVGKMLWADDARLARKYPASFTGPF